MYQEGAFLAETYVWATPETLWGEVQTDGAPMYEMGSHRQEPLHKTRR